MYQLESYEKLENIVNNWLNEGTEENDDNVSTTTHREQSTAKSTDTGKTFNKIDDAFADLENFDL